MYPCTLPEATLTSIYAGTCGRGHSTEGKGLGLCPFPLLSERSPRSRITREGDRREKEWSEMELRFYLPMEPPRTTAQQKRVVVKNGRQMRYEGQALADAHAKLRAHLAPHRPQEPLRGAVRLMVKWMFPDKGCAHRHGAYKVTRPDTDNLQKLLKDVMTECHFWTDDAQVCSEIAEKFWVREKPGIYVEVGEIGEDG